jgi:hypothetical protein
MKWYLVDNEVYSEKNGQCFRHSTSDEEGPYVEHGSPLQVAFIPDGYQIPRKQIPAKKAKELIAKAKKSDRSS